MGFLPTFNAAQSNNNNQRKDDRHTSSREKMAAIKFFSGLGMVVLVPYIHIGVVHKLIWVPNKPAVDQEQCTCSCFDTVFKGPYESTDIGYKHIYFNATHQTLKIWTVTAFYFLLLYETIKYFISIGVKRQIRWTMTVLFLSNIYPLYYSWWSFFNYYNDDFYEQFNHQILFTVTEIVTAVIVLQSCDSSKDLVPRKLLAVITISVLHLTLGGMDQFIAHILLGDGEKFQRSRDLGLSLPDVLHVVIPAVLLYKLSRRNNGAVLSKFDLVMCAIFLITVLCIGYAL